MTSPKETIKAHCPTCRDDRNAEILHRHTEKWRDDDAGMWGHETSLMLKCAGCGTVYFQVSEVNSEDIGPDGPEERITYWPPAARRQQPEWMFSLLLEDDKLHSLFVETYIALNGDARVLAAIGLRTIFDRVSEKFRVPTNLPFEKKLQSLHAKGKIGQGELESLAILTDAGSAAAHRGWKPKTSELNTLMNIAENFIYRTLILAHEAKKLKKAIPKRKRRR